MATSKKDEYFFNSYISGYAGEASLSKISEKLEKTAPYFFEFIFLNNVIELFKTIDSSLPSTFTSFISY